MNAPDPDFFAAMFADARDPFALFAQWMAAADGAEVNDPSAATLATIDPHGIPDARIVLIKDWHDGFTFYTNLGSAKSQQLRAHPHAAMIFHWKSLRLQTRARGSVAPVSDAEANAYFASRPRGSQLGAWASRQSRPLAKPEDLTAAYAATATRFGDAAIPRPDWWSGWRLAPTAMEFWVSRHSRLHDRLVFHREDAAVPWRSSRLQP